MTMFIKELQQERSILVQQKNHHLQKLHASGNPEGILLFHKHHNGYRWQRRSVLEGHPYTEDLRKTDRQTAEKLAVNLYRMICIRYLQQQLDSIDFLLRNAGADRPEGDEDSLYASAFTMQPLFPRVRNIPRVPADFFSSTSPYRMFLVAFLQREYAEILAWYLRKFPHNEEHPEHLLFPVRLGYNVRSKSEVLEADCLFEEGILFHYEEELVLQGGVAYPDFYIPITLLEKYAWEHFGGMDSERYFHRTRGKILDYLDSQWFPGINMITTYETRQHPLTEEDVLHKVRWLKNRYRLAFPDLPPDESFNMYDLASTVQEEKGTMSELPAVAAGAASAASARRSRGRGGASRAR